MSQLIFFFILFLIKLPSSALLGSLAAFRQCSTLDFTLPIKIESATDERVDGGEDDDDNRATWVIGILSRDMDS